MEAAYWLGSAQASGFGEPGGGWGWITGEPFVYETWNSDEPNDALDITDDCNEDAIHFFDDDFPAANGLSALRANGRSGFSPLARPERHGPTAQAIG